MTDGHQHAADNAIVARLRETPLFADLAEAPLRALVAAGDIVDLRPGDALIREGDEADALYVVLDGQLEVTKRSGRSEIPVTMVGPGALQGEIAALEGGRRLASVRAVTEAEAFRIPVSAVRDLLVMGPDVAVTIVSTVVGRIRALEATLREREKLAALGTLAAGLAHELNNPAAAAMRAIDNLDAAVRRAESLPHPTPPPRPPEGSEPPRSALERSDRIEGLAAVTGDEEAAAALADAGWTPETLEGLPRDVHGWVAADAAVHLLLGELRMALGRMQEIVAAVKGFSYLDRAPIGRVDVRIGLEQTLVILRHRLREIEVDLRIDAGLPEIEGYGPELNQVWANLVDNAIDAMDGRGTLTITAEPAAGDGVRVTVCDSGAGIAPDVRARLFEPFATTKPPGRGTGLGLHITHNVVARHGGRIEVESEPGRTCFVVSLPARPPAVSDDPPDGRELGASPAAGR